MNLSALFFAVSFLQALDNQLVPVLLPVLALLVLGAAPFAFGATTGFPVRLIARTAAGAASGVLSMTLLLAASQIQDERSRAQQFTVINAGYLCALVLGVPLGAVVT